MKILIVSNAFIKSELWTDNFALDLLDLEDCKRESVEMDLEDAAAVFEEWSILENLILLVLLKCLSPIRPPGVLLILVL